MIGTNLVISIHEVGMGSPVKRCASKQYHVTVRARRHGITHFRSEFILQKILSGRGSSVVARCRHGPSIAGKKGV